MKYLKCLLVILFLTVGFAYWNLTKPANYADGAFFEIKAGENFSEILTDLKEKNLIRSKFIAKWYARWKGLDTEIKAGRFRLEQGMSPAKVLRFLAQPEYGEVSVTIPEGFTIFDIDKKLVALDLIKPGEFSKWAAEAEIKEFIFLGNGDNAPRWEGYLFPDTYFVFAHNFAPQELGQVMLKNFEKKVMVGLKDDLASPMPGSGQATKRSLQDIIIMASIVEKEAREPEDLPIVAGILWKRLENNWPLQADATLLYGRTDRSLSLDNLREDSAYNTYTRLGLPKTAINNPGLAAIKAALHPTETPYWFYLTSRDGKMIYAETNQQHNENKKHL